MTTQSNAGPAIEPGSGLNFKTGAGPQWVFEQDGNGMWAIKLGGGSRNCQVHLYPAEFDALIKAAAYLAWQRDIDA